MRNKPNIMSFIKKKNGSKLDLSSINRDKRAIDLISDILDDRKDTAAQWILDEIWKDIGLLKILSIHPERLQFSESMNPKIVFDLIDVEELIKKETNFESEEQQLESDILSILSDIQQNARYSLHPDLKPVVKLFGDGGLNIKFNKDENQIGVTLPEDVMNIVNELPNLKKIVCMDMKNIVGILNHYLINIGLQLRHDLIIPLGLERKRYHKLIKKMQRQYVILPLFSTFLCLKHPENPQYAISIGSIIHPNIKCSRCEDSKQLHSVTGVFYSFEDRINEMLSRNGGFLPHAVMWFLEKHGIQWIPDVPFIGPEKPKPDIIAKCNKIDKYALFEVKCFEIRDKKSRIISQFEPVIREQLIPTISMGLEKDIPVVGGYILTNYSEKITKDFNGSCNDLEKLGLELLGSKPQIDIPEDFQIKIVSIEKIKQTLIEVLNIKPKN